MVDKKQSDPVEATDAVTAAGMSDARFAQFVRLESLKVAEANGRAHGKIGQLVISDAVLFAGYVMSGKAPG